MGIDPAVFWRLSLHEWLIMQRGFYINAEQREQREWERARLIAYYALRPHVKQGKMMTYESFIRFPWEMPQEKPIPTKQDMEYIIRKYGRYYDVETDKFVN